MERVFARFINLAARKDRAELMRPIVESSKHAGLDLQRLEATDVKSLTRQDLSLRVACDLLRHRGSYEAMPSLGAVACFKSHCRVWTEFLESEKEFCIVLEDDLRSNQEQVFLQNVKEALQSFDWDMFLLGWNLKLPPARESGHLVVFPESRGFEGGHAYMITRRAARDLVRHAAEVSMQVDFFVQAVAWKEGLRVRHARNPLKQSYTGSDISSLMNFICVSCDARIQAGIAVTLVVLSLVLGVLATKSFLASS